MIPSVAPLTLTVDPLCQYVCVSEGVRAGLNERVRGRCQAGWRCVGCQPWLGMQAGVCLHGCACVRVRVHPSCMGACSCVCVCVIR